MKEHPLKIHRRLYRLTQAEMAKIIGVNTSQVSRVEAWLQSMNRKNAKKANEATGIPRDIFLFPEDFRE